MFCCVIIVFCLIVCQGSDIILLFKDAQVSCGGREPGMCGNMGNVRSLAWSERGIRALSYSGTIRN